MYFNWFSSTNGGVILLSQEAEPAGGGGEVGQLWQDIEEGLREQAARLSSENRELQERLMVSEATVHAQAEQLKDYRDLLSESRSRSFLTFLQSFAGMSPNANRAETCSKFKAMQ